MKKLLFFLTALIILSIGCDDNNNVEEPCNYIDFMYYNDAMYPLGELSNDYILIAFDSTYSDSTIENFISTKEFFDQSYDYTIQSYTYYGCKLVPMRFNESKTCEQITTIISILELATIVVYAHYTIQTDDCSGLIPELPLGNLCVNSYSSLFYINVFDQNNLTDLNNMIAQTNTELVEQNQFMPDWFTLRATKNSDGDALRMANYFYESGLFIHGNPDVLKIPVE